MQKSTTHAASNWALLYASISAKFRAALDRLAPVGYQDENGFHLGATKAGEQKTWPPVD